MSRTAIKRQDITWVSIGDVERETGLSKDTLRVWEKRYGFPTPKRDARDERVYSDEQVRRLRVLRRLVDSGLRPSRVVGLPEAELSAVAATPSSGVAAQPEPPESIQRVLQIIRKHQAESLRQHLNQQLMRLGLRQFILELIVPLNRAVGDAWMRGALEIFEEHFYTNHVQLLLQHALGGLPHASSAPRVLLTTLPGEEHQLGLLMAQAFFAMDDACCVSLGTETPIADIVRAVDAHRIDVVGLSCNTNPLRPPQSQLASLRSRLGAQTELWVGGTVASVESPHADGIRRVRSLPEISGGVRQWRENHLHDGI